MADLTPGAFRPVPRTGVIYVTAEAAARGYKPGDPGWANLGQGSPETGPLEGAPPRVAAITIDPAHNRYGPVAGDWALREAVAALYNRLYRRGLPSQYSAENVCIAGGGRLALTRAVAALGNVNLGHFLPDYTAYEELLSNFRLFSPIPILLDRERGYRFDAADLRREVVGRGLGAVLRSNPCNPTGEHLRGDALRGWVEAARELDCTLIFDEFYAHYAWTDDAPGPSSAAAMVEDVERDPVIVIDGLTKNWRYPGWRLSWTLGPRRVIEALASAGSFLDGGAALPLQHAALPLLEPSHVLQEAGAIRRAFLAKRAQALEAARAIGLRVDHAPEGTFYLWASLEDLPPPYDDGMTFFRRALERKVICVPGEFFDVNPGKRRPGTRGSRFGRHVRISFGPPAQEVELGLQRLRAMIPAL